MTSVSRSARPLSHAAPLLLAAAISLFAAAGCDRARRDAAPVHAEVGATTVAARLQTVPVVVSVGGSVEAAQRATVSTRMMGWVRQVHVREGDVVRRGSRLVTIDDGDLRAKQEQVEAGINEARAVLENAERMAARFERLYAEKAVSKQQLDDVLTGRERARAGLAAAEAGRAELATHLRYLDIVSPIGGLVVRKTVEPGDMANPGQPLVVVEQVDEMKIVARLGEKDIGAVAIGDTVMVEIGSLGAASGRRAVLEKVVAAADRASRTFEIETRVDNADGRLKSGMFARVLVPVGERQAVLVPRAAVLERGQLRGLFVLDEAGLARLRWVRLGHDFGDRVEVLAGLSDGETVAMSPERPLVEGDKVVTR